ncbi:MAG: ribonuclease H-like domain-containing protein [Deltaproteobacteria bacterium]|nr:ribonuclease H-like domain-containing protein [Deltaproteobacteria bacterium]
MSRLLYFDLETKYSADEVGGWSNIMDMGMSVGVIYDTTDQDYHVYLEHQIPALIEHLKKGDLIVGFNSVGFDLRVVAGSQPTNELRHRLYLELQALNNLDILTEVTNVLGHRLKLDSIARPTLETAKSADGLQALRWYKEGRMDLIIEYCKQDVAVTRGVHEFALKNGYLLYESRAGVKKVEIDLGLKQTAEQPAAEQMSLFD